MTQTDPSAFPPVTVSRLAHRRFVGRSSRGGEVAIGDASFPDTFTPGELLKVALAACAGFTAESAVTRRLGDDAAMTIEVGGDKDPAQDRYPGLPSASNWTSHRWTPLPANDSSPSSPVR